jgi:hypothetical protein
MNKEKKYPTQKRAGRMVQVVEHKPSKWEALNSNPRTTPPHTHTVSTFSYKNHKLEETH